MDFLNVAQFLQSARHQPVIDFRSPSEFSQGHIPGAFNLPLFTDEERKRVGTFYKNSGKEASVLLGLEITGPKLAGYVKKLQKITHSRDILLHCWRGGMRSNGMAWLIEIAGYHAGILRGGYKAYRSYIREQIGMHYPLIVLGGYTGSGKTEILSYIQEGGGQVLDLEKIAHHKGSAFGHLGQNQQPTNEQFENDVFFELSKFDPDKPVWIEDESRSIGNVSIPDSFYLKMKESPLIFLEIDRKYRVPKLINEYANYKPSLLEKAILKISDKLGGLNAKNAINAVYENNFSMAIELVLNYYDKAYLIGLEKGDQSRIHKLKVDPVENKNIARKLIEFSSSGVLKISS